MREERRHWLRQFFVLFLVAGLIQLCQAASGLLLGRLASSPVLLVFGADALVGACREFVMARRIARQVTADEVQTSDRPLLGVVALGYLAAGLAALVAGGIGLWRGSRPESTLLGVALAAVSMLLIPVVGSYMKAVAVELKSPALKSAAIFTFGNSYLSMVLLISLLVRSGMERWWGDPLGALVMSPFILGKGIQILSEQQPSEFNRDSGGGGEGDSP